MSSTVVSIRNKMAQLEEINLATIWCCPSEEPASSSSEHLCFSQPDKLIRNASLLKAASIPLPKTVDFGHQKGGFLWIYTKIDGWLDKCGESG